MKNSTKLFSIILMLFTFQFSAVGQIVLTLDGVNTGVICNETWIEEGLEIGFVATTSADCDGGGNCFFGVDPTQLWLFPSRLSVDLSSLSNIYLVEVDVVDYCGTNCTRSFLEDAGGTVDTDWNTVTSNLETLMLANPTEGLLDFVAVSSCEGVVEEIRIYQNEISSCGVFATAPVDLTKSFQPVPFPNGDVDRVQLKFYKSSPEVKYSPTDDAALDIEFWPIRDLTTNTPIVNGPVTLLADKTKPGQDFFKWPVKFIRPDIDPNIRYAWRLRVKCQSGDLTVSPWSAEKIFNTPDFDPVTGIYTPPPGAFSDNEVKSLFNNSEIALMPNPASESIRITNVDGLPESFDWYIMDMTGRLVLDGNVRGNKGDYLQIDLNDVAQGTYQIIMLGNEFSANAPLMIRR